MAIVMMAGSPQRMWAQAEIVSTDVTYLQTGSKAVIKFTEYQKISLVSYYWKNTPTLYIDDTSVIDLGTLWGDLGSSTASDHTGTVSNTTLDNNAKDIKLNDVTIGTAKLQNHTSITTAKVTIELHLTFNQNFSFYGHKIELKGNFNSKNATTLTTYMNGYPRPKSLTATQSGFNVKLSWSSEKYNDNDNYEFYTISGVDGSNLQTTKATGTLAAGTPVLIHKKVEGQYKLILTADNKDVSTTITNPAADVDRDGDVDIDDVNALRNKLLGE